MLDSLRKIKEAEEKAVKRIEQARMDAEKLLAETKEQAEQLVEKTVEEARKEAEVMMEKACSEARSEAEKIIREGSEISTAVKASAEKRIDPAVKVIIGQIIGEA